MLISLVPVGVVRSRKREVYEVIDELAGIIEEEDVSSWSKSRKGCVEWICTYLRLIYLPDPNLRPKLGRLEEGWNSEE